MPARRYQHPPRLRMRHPATLQVAARLNAHATAAYVSAVNTVSDAGTEPDMPRLLAKLRYARLTNCDRYVGMLPVMALLARLSMLQRHT